MSTKWPMLLLLQFSLFPANSLSELASSGKAASVAPFIFCHVECTNKCHSLLVNPDKPPASCSHRRPQILLHFCDHFCCDKYPIYAENNAPCGWLKADQGLLGRIHREHLENGTVVVAIFAKLTDNFVSVSSDGKSLSTELSYQADLRGHFELHRKGESGIYLLRAKRNAKWVGASTAEGGNLVARASRPRGWEEFRLEAHREQCGAYYTIRWAKNGKMVIVDMERGQQEGILRIGEEGEGDNAELHKFYLSQHYL